MLLPGLGGFMPADAAVLLIPGTVTVGVDSTTVTNTFSYTATGLTVGKPMIIFIGGVRDSGFTSRVVNACTVGGSAATALIPGPTGQTYTGALYYFSPTATSHTVSVTFSGNMGAAQVGHFQLLGTAQTTYSSRSGAALSQSAASSVTTPAIAIPTGGVGIALCVGLGDLSAAAMSWSVNNGGTATKFQDARIATSGMRVSLAYTNSTASTTFTESDSGGITNKQYGAFAWDD
jgi:hypothetical protein